ncbi:hypothetical protein O3M35_013208 [Rhynocoris fuscipes]|uniref:ATP-dependent RNA helicase n=1 Tax=Rhynocoris fuscipes TaxID=488301 RepID=A0AAW1CGU5_9HEMI
MSSIRFKGDISDEIGSDSIHYDKFLNKVKKRQLKMEEEGEKLIRKKYKDNVRCVNEKLVDEPAVSRVNGSDQFTRIGASNQLVRTNIQLKPVLPNWILNPIIIPINAEEITDEMPKFHDRITANLLENNIVNYFPVQRKVIPWIMNQFNSKGNLDYIPQDGCVCAPTGSGKTLAYVLPIVQILLGHFLPRIRCLVLVPVQQLAIQVAKVFRSIIKGTSLKVAAIYGGNAPLKVEQEMLTKEIKVSEYSSKYETVMIF